MQKSGLGTPTILMMMKMRLTMMRTTRRLLLLPLLSTLLTQTSRPEHLRRCSSLGR